MIQHRHGTYVNKHGAALTLALGLVAVLALVGMTTVTITTTEHRTSENYTQIASYYTTGAQAFYAAEAGLEEARARLRVYAGLYRIVDDAPHDPQWRVSIGSDSTFQEQGDAAQQYTRVASLQTDLSYTVTIRHATRDADATVLHWGDVHGEGSNTRNTTHGESIYVITAHGVMGEARRTVEIEAAPEPPPTVSAALYVEGPVRLQENRISISGMDRCGEQDQPGVRTTLPPSPLVHQNGTTQIIVAVENQEEMTITGAPPIAYHSTNMHVQAMIDTFKERADMVYVPITTRTVTAGSTPNAGEPWGSPRLGPTLQEPSTCQERHLVHYDTRGTLGRLEGGTSGCGLLLIEGDVEIHGDFSWYGAVLVAGSLRLTGGGTKHVTGGMVVEGAVTIDEDGETHLVYCSEAITQQTRYLPLRILAWRDVLPTTY